MRANYLAFDLGAESGRAMSGRLRSGILDLVELCRFPNEPVRVDGSLYWDAPRLWLHVQRALGEVPARPRVDSIGVDTWGCDYGLLGENGELLGNPFHYRDARTDGVMEDVFTRVPRAQIYDVTGIQFLPFNTLYQLVAAARLTPRLLDAAIQFGTIPDILNYWLTGELRAEYTNATTTQMVEARSRTWAFDLLRQLDVPARLLPPLVEPGTILGPLQRSLSAALEGTPVVAPACHDTGSAVASVPAHGRRAFLSSGTWSLLGTEVPRPIITPRALDANFTNEGGVCGTTRVLKNISGLWLLQGCRRDWADDGRHFEYAELVAAAADYRPPFRSLFDPDDPAFLHPERMTRAIAAYCRRTAQPEPDGPAACTRAIFESLAFKYRVVLDTLEGLTGSPITELQIVGGGSRNRLLNQFTADATGRTVIAGPVEATALGNIAMQMLATGAVSTLAEARGIIEHSFPVERFAPAAADCWNAEYRRFQNYVELTCV
ncbi:MAG TPA: rhamnulokinase family protein [Vicinamibacterales bacterium]|nr:rhamnulokinase family protein [Vicinamibacterales bacterium]